MDGRRRRLYSAKGQALLGEIIAKKQFKDLGEEQRPTARKAKWRALLFNRAGDLDTRYYPVRKRPISGAVKVGVPGLKMAIEKVMKDMNVYLARKNKEASDKLKL
jgi:hypothetical protein